MPKRPLTLGQQKAMHIIGKVLDQQADEEPNLWYRFLKRRAAGWALALGWPPRRPKRRKR